MVQIWEVPVITSRCSSVRFACISKNRKMSEKKILSMMDKGVTVLFVSHSLEQVKRICTKAMILENGSIRSIGDIDTVSAEYEEMISGD